MKTLIFVFMAFLPCLTIAQDVIVKKDGNTILAKVLEVNESNIKYKKYSNQNGPTYTIAIVDIMSINYQNGERDEFVSTSEISYNDSNIPQYINKPGDSLNAELLSLYNQTYVPKKSKASTSKASKYILFFGFKTSSILSNEDLVMTWVKKTTSHEGTFSYTSWGIKLKNKTNKVIYVDKGNCFRVLRDGDSYCYLNDEEQVTVNQGGGSGASIGLGAIASAVGIGGIAGQLASGITIGGGTTHSVSTTFNPRRIVAIPPGGQVDLSDERYVTMRTGLILDPPTYKLIEEGEVLDFYFLSKTRKVIEGRTADNFSLPKGLTTIGNTRIFDEDETPYTRKYVITYSTDANFHTYSSLESELYLHEIVGYNGKRTIGFSAKIIFDVEKYIDGINQYTIDGYYKCE